MIYFDNGATSYPKPKEVKLSTFESVSSFGANPGRGGYEMSLKTARQVFLARKNLSRLFNTEPELVVFTLNCTHALNTAIKGFLKEGDHVIITDLEHNSVLRPLERLKDDGKISYSVFETFESDEKTLLSLERELSSHKNTSLVVTTHASNAFGFVLPIRKIGRLLKERKIAYLVDGAQSAGTLPIDMEKDFIDMLCVPGHKGLYGVSGTGAFVLGRTFSKVCDSFKTLTEGGTGNVSLSKKMPTEPPERFEAGSLNTLGIISLLAGTNYVLKRGVEKINEREIFLSILIYKELSKMDEVVLYSPNPMEKDQAVPIITFNLKKGEEIIFSEKTAELLAKEGIALRGGFQCALLAHKKMGTESSGAVRISLGDFNTLSQCEILLSKIKKIAKEI